MSRRDMSHVCYEDIFDQREAAQRVDASTVPKHAAFGSWLLVPGLTQKMPKTAKQQPSIPIFGSEEPLATVLAALEIEGNDVCFDCDRSVIGDEWLSAQHGTVHCIQCAGVHRSLGVHVSFVRSLRLDTLKQAELVALQLGGNAKFSKWLEAEHGVKRHVWLALPLELRYTTPAAELWRQRMRAEAAGEALPTELPRGDRPRREPEPPPPPAPQPAPPAVAPAAAPAPAAATEALPLHPAVAAAAEMAAAVVNASRSPAEAALAGGGSAVMLHPSLVRPALPVAVAAPAAAPIRVGRRPPAVATEPAPPGRRCSSSAVLAPPSPQLAPSPPPPAPPPPGAMPGTMPAVRRSPDLTTADAPPPAPRATAAPCWRRRRPPATPSATARRQAHRRARRARRSRRRRGSRDASKTGATCPVASSSGARRRVEAWLPARFMTEFTGKSYSACDVPIYAMGGPRLHDAAPRRAHKPHMLERWVSSGSSLLHE